MGAGSADFFPGQSLGGEAFIFADLPHLPRCMQGQDDDEAPQDQIGPARIGPEGHDTHGDDREVDEHVVAGRQKSCPAERAALVPDSGKQSRRRAVDGDGAEGGKDQRHDIRGLRVAESLDRLPPGQGRGRQDDQRHGLAEHGAPGQRPP